MNDKKDLFREIIDESIEVDVSILPKALRELIEELEVLHKKRDWFFYDLKFDELENRAKSYIINRQLS